ncbi:hypothetical protein CKO31_23615 [Thiohalocapsa halophila]|uniref:Type II toxin-antitoxin system RelE/ParE family toxin n=1 Tax=Thiohalocapsa halophila TaxID=69359 RepID=A0ABS1CP10_9GAMM|nr:type II toxin-antitoxin system RelE/ParE family toxin [Thiohalocapsa halophila]MBK1633676.1 hypothetical protein [Thiohalocapsa halophila]
MKATYTSRAVAELESACHWYERQREGLGDEFLDEVDAALARIQGRPALFPEVRPGFRRCLTHRFPFSLIYTAEDEHLVVHAVFHTRRDPEALP